MSKRDRVRLLGLILIALVISYGAYWILQSPVRSGLYPARMGGAYFSTYDRPDYGVRAIWVRPFPWSKTPPTMTYLALVTDEGEQVVMVGTWSPTLEWHYPNRPVWLRPRSVEAVITAPFPKEGVRVTGVVWQLAGEEKRHYTTGEMTLEWAPSVRSTIGIYGFAPQIDPDDEASRAPQSLIGHYIVVRGIGRLLDIVPSTAGSEHPISGLLYQEGSIRSGWSGRYFEGANFKPLTLPFDLTSGMISIYMPMGEAGQARLRDTLYYFSPALVVEGIDGEHLVVAGGASGAGDSGWHWRSWVPFFIYESEPIQ